MELNLNYAEGLKLYYLELLEEAQSAHLENPESEKYKLLESKIEAVEKVYRILYK